MSDSTSTPQGRSRLPRFLTKSARYVLRRLAVRGQVVLGADVRVGRNAVITSTHGLTIGSWSSIGPNTIIQVNGSIGPFALIGMGVQIVGRDDHAIDEVGVPISLSTWIGDREGTARDRVEIGRDVWIGGGSIVMSGVSIGEGCVIGSGSVVTRDLPAYSVAAGIPTRVIRSRFSNETDRQAHSQALDALEKRQ